MQLASKVRSRNSPELPSLIDREHVLTRLEQGWFMGDGAAVGVTWMESQPDDLLFFDTRNCVLAANTVALSNHHERLLSEPGKSDCSSEPTYRVEASGLGVRVIADCEPGRWVEWLIDDGEPPLVRTIRRFHQDRMVVEVQLSWRRIEDQPVIERVQYLQLRRGGVEDRRELRLVRAALAEAPPLRPEDAGLDVGTNINRSLPDGSLETHPDTPYVKLWTWDGSGIRPWGEVIAQVHRGDLEMGERFRRDLALGALQRQAQEKLGQAQPSNWRSFVRMFIQAYHLDDEQQQKAWTIHDHALDRFRQDAARLASPEALRQEVQRTLQTTQALVDQGLGVSAIIAAQQTERASDRLSELSELAARCFRDLLVDRVYQLPTRAQLRDANETYLLDAFPELRARSTSQKSED
jgi:hypothetical protein